MSNNLKETVQGRENVFTGRVVTLDLYTVSLPDGQQARREIVQHPGAVGIVAIDEQNHILLVKQFRTAAGKIMLEIPAGTLEPGEDPALCAERELQEEVGYRPGKLEAMGGIYAAPGYTTEYIHLFAASNLQKSQLPLDDDEFIAVERMPFLDALRLIDSGEINDSKTVAGLLRIARMRQS